MYLEQEVSLDYKNIALIPEDKEDYDRDSVTIEALVTFYSNGDICDIELQDWDVNVDFETHPNYKQIAKEAEAKIEHMDFELDFAGADDAACCANADFHAGR